MYDFKNNDNNLLENYMASQIFYHQSYNIMDQYIKYFNKKRDE